MASEKQIVIGTMSGTSVDAVDVALLETDGANSIRPIAFAERPYTDAERELIRRAAALALQMERPGPDPLIAEAEHILTKAHAEAIFALPDYRQARLIGFHGQTVAHRPPSSGHAHPFTWQIGDAGLLARLTDIAVVHDFRSDDVAAGGEGAPLAPGYHRALASGLEWPVGVLNLGGVGNLTWFSEDAWGGFDTGPANGLIDDWVAAHTGQRFDSCGALAAAGRVREEVVARMADRAFFTAEGPKSLDRGDFDLAAVSGLGTADGAATLTAFTAETIRIALDRLPLRLNSLLVTGGGRHNPTLMQMIAERCAVPVRPVEDFGWNGDALEAEAFGWMAVRHVRGLPISWPETTGVPAPARGGKLVSPQADAAVIA